MVGTRGLLATTPGSASAEEMPLTGNVLDWWHLCSEAEEEVKLLGQPCVNIAASPHGLEPSECGPFGPETRYVRTWDRGYLAVKPSTAAPGKKSSLPAALETPVAEASGSGPRSPGFSVARHRLVVTHFGPAVALPLSARAVHIDGDGLRPFFVAVGNWETVQHYGDACATAEEALDKLEERAQETFFSEKSEAVHFEFSVETLVVAHNQPAKPGVTSPRVTSPRRLSWHRRPSIEIDGPAVIGELALGGVLLGEVRRDPEKGNFYARSLRCLSSMSSPEESSISLTLRQQVSSWMTELSWCPSKWRLVTASPQMQYESSMHPGHQYTDVDIQVQAKLSIAASPTVRHSLTMPGKATAEHSEEIPEPWCYSIAQGLRKVAGLPSDSPMLKVSMPKSNESGKNPQTRTAIGVSPLLEPSPPASPSRQSRLVAGARPNTASNYATPHRRHFVAPPSAVSASRKQGGEKEDVIELDLTIQRWGFGLLNTSPKRSFPAEDRLAVDGKCIGADDGILELVPGTMMALHLSLPHGVAEAVRSMAPPLEFLLVLVPMLAASSCSVKGLMNDALLFERFPADADQALGPGLEVTLPVPNHLSALQQARTELRIYLASGNQTSIMALGRSLPCCILPSPNPLAVLSNLTASLLRHRMGLPVRIPRSGTSAVPPANIEETAWNFAGLGNSNISLELSAVLLCDDMDQPRIQRLVTLRAAVPGPDGRPTVAKVLKLPDAPEPPQVVNESQIGDQRVVVDGEPLIGIMHDGGAFAYRIECIRVANADAWSMPANPAIVMEQQSCRQPDQHHSPTKRPKGKFLSSVCSSLLHLAEVSAVANEGQSFNVKIANLVPGRYVFRAQSLGACGYGAFSQASTPEVLVPSEVEQRKCLEEVARVMQLGQAAGSSNVLENAKREAIMSGVDEAHPTLVEASKSIQSLQKSFRRQSFNSWQKSEAALAKLQTQTTLNYRPELEKVLKEAARHGADEGSHIMRKARAMLRQLQANEREQQVLMHQREKRLEKSIEELKGAIAAPRSVQVYRLHDAIHLAEKVGINVDNKYLKEARRQLKEHSVSAKLQRKKARNALRSASAASNRSSLLTSSVSSAMASPRASFPSSMVSSRPASARSSRPGSPRSARSERS